MDAAWAGSDGAAGRFARGVLRAGWPGTRVLKSAVAGVAWYVAARFGDPAPMFAVFGALNGMQPTVAASVRSTSGTLLGIVLGTVLAVVSEQFVDAPRSVMVALLVALGLLTALRLNAYTLLGTEVAVTGLLVFGLSQGSVQWALVRLGETALEDTIHPPSRETARAHLIAVRASSRRADELVGQTARAQEALRFSPVLRYSPLRRTTPAEIERYTSGVTALAAGLGHARTACRAAWHATRRSVRLDPPVGDWDGLLAVIEPALARFEQYVLDGSSPAFEAAEIAVRYAMAKHAEVVSTTRAATQPWDIDRWSVLAEIEQVLDDLRRALRDQPRRAS